MKRLPSKRTNKDIKKEWRAFQKAWENLKKNLKIKK